MCCWATCWTGSAASGLVCFYSPHVVCLRYFRFHLILMFHICLTSCCRRAFYFYKSANMIIIKTNLSQTNRVWMLFWLQWDVTCCPAWSFRVLIWCSDKNQSDDDDDDDDDQLIWRKVQLKKSHRNHIQELFLFFNKHKILIFYLINSKYKKGVCRLGPSGGSRSTSWWWGESDTDNKCKCPLGWSDRWRVDGWASEELVIVSSRPSDKLVPPVSSLCAKPS